MISAGGPDPLESSCWILRGSAKLSQKGVNFSLPPDPFQLPADSLHHEKASSSLGCDHTYKPGEFPRKRLAFQGLIWQGLVVVELFHPNVSSAQEKFQPVAC